MNATPEPRGTVVDAPGGRELQLRREFTAGIDRVWAALTTSAGLEPWIGRIEGDPASGRVTFFMTAEGGDVPPEECVITECTPPRTFSIDTSVGEDAWHLRVALSEDGGGTRLLFAQVLGAEPAGSVGPGWEYYLDRLGCALAGEDVAGVVWDDYYPALKDHYDALAR